jgi:hypothetical protein
MEETNKNISSFQASTNINYGIIQKMLFLCNALNDGWSIKKLSNNSYEFIKNKDKLIKKEIDIEEFIKNNLNIENLKKI